MKSGVKGTVSLELKDEYKNMECIVKDHFLSDRKCKKKHVSWQEPCLSSAPIRGRYGWRCKLSFKGLPCPNLGTGGHGYHGPLEHCIGRRNGKSGTDYCRTCKNICRKVEENRIWKRKRKKKKLSFPSALTVLFIVLIFCGDPDSGCACGSVFQAGL